MEEEIEKLRSQVAELLEWKRQREGQSIAYPLDDQSKNAIGGATDDGAGTSATTQSIALSGDPESINVPAAYLGTRIIILGGVRYEIPYITIS